MKKLYCDKCGKEIKVNKEKYHCIFPNLEEYQTRHYDFCEKCFYDIIYFIRNMKEYMDKNE